jgi:hypothetical protein
LDESNQLFNASCNAPFKFHVSPITTTLISLQRRSALMSEPTHEDQPLPSPTYINHPVLPHDARITRARILNDAEGVQGKLWDYIATVLNHLANPAGYPKALEEFFDPTVTTFKFSHQHPGTDSSIEIRREGDKVLVSWYRT